MVFIVIYVFSVVDAASVGTRKDMYSSLGIRRNGFLLCHQFRLAQQSKSREIIISKLSTCKCAQIFIYTTHYTA